MNDPYQSRYYWEEKSWMQQQEELFRKKLREESELLYSKMKNRCDTVKKLVGLK